MTDVVKLKLQRMRLDTRSRHRLEQAAACEETTTAPFVLGNAVAERVVLSATDWQAFHKALLNPPAPNAALRAPPTATASAWGNIAAPDRVHRLASRPHRLFLPLQTFMKLGL